MTIDCSAGASVASFVAPVTDGDPVNTPEELSLNSKRDATSKSVSRSTYCSSDSEEKSHAYETLIGFRCNTDFLREALSSEGLVRMAGIMCHVSLTGA